MNCHLCKEQNKLSEACYWCQDCNEAICDTCNTFHKTFKLSKFHIVTPLTGQQNEQLDKRDTRGVQQKASKNFRQFCEEHPDKPLKYYCIKHKQPICLICKRKSHRDGCDVEKIEDVIDEIFVTGKAQKIESKTEEQIRTIHELKSKEEQLVNKTETIFNNAIEKLEKAREKINNHIDELEKKVKQQIETQKDLKLSPSKTYVSELRNSEEILVQNNNDVQETLSMTGVSACNKYFQLMNIERKYMAIDSKLKLLSRSEKTNEINLGKLEYTVTSNGIDIAIHQGSACHKKENNKSQEQTHDEETGSSVVELESKETIKTGNQAKYRAPGESLETVRNETAFSNSSSTKYSYKSKFVVEKQNKTLKIVDMKLLQNKCDIAMVVTWRELNRGMFYSYQNSQMCYNVGRKLMVYKKTGNKRGQILFDKDPDSIAVIDDRRVAVTFPDEHVIRIIDVMEFKCILSFDTDTTSVSDDPRGIAYFDNQLYVNICEYGLTCYSYSGYRLWKIKGITGDLYFHVDKYGNLFSINKNSRSILAFNLRNKSRSFFNIKELLEPSGLATNGEGHLFVACCESNKIFLKESRHCPGFELLNSSDNLDKPTRIDYDDVNEELLVVNNDGHYIYIFKKSEKVNF